MPEFAQEQFNQRKQVDTSSTPVKTQVVASPVSTYVSPAESDLKRLGDALGSMVPMLQQKQLAEEKVQHDSEAAQGFASAKKGDPMSPDSSPWSQQGYIKGHWDTQAQTSADAARTEYDTAKNDPSFNPDEFLQKHAAKDLEGITNPTAIASYMDTFGPLSTQIKNHFQQHQQALLHEQRNSDFSSSVSGMVAQLTDPSRIDKIDGSAFLTARENLFSTYGVGKPGVPGMGMTNKEMNTAMLASFESASMKAGGNPNSFDIFYQPDPVTGKSPVEMDTDLGVKVETARHQATFLYDSKMQKGTMMQRGDDEATFMDNVRAGKWSSVTDEQLQSYRGEHGWLHDANAYNSARNHRDTELAKASLGEHLNDLSNRGNLSAAKPEHQKDQLTRLTQPESQVVYSTIDQPGNAAADAIASTIKINSNSGSSEVVPWLKQLTSTVSNMAPDPNSKDAKPTARFLNLAGAYQAMKNAPNGSMVGQYFADADSVAIMDNFQWRKADGQDDATAYREAFRMNSAENKAKSAEFLGSTAGAALVKSSVTNAITGVGVQDGDWRPNMLRTTGWSLPFIGQVMQGSIPPDQSAITAGATIEAGNYIKSTGIADPKLVEEHLTAWARSNFVHDATTNTVVRIPPGKASAEVSNAISSYTADRAVEGYTNEKGVKVVGRITLDHLGGNNYAEVIHPATGNPYRIFPDTSLEIIENKFKMKSQLSASERDTYATLQNKVANGGLTAQDLADNSAIIKKLDTLNLWNGAAATQTQELRTTAGREVGAMMKRAKELGLSPRPISNDISAIPDLGAKRPIAASLMKQGDQGAALTVMGEGVALKVYTAPEGNPTIGIGYNMTANASTIKEDFRKSGIVASAEDIQLGKASISQEQAVRLYKVVQPRYEALAKGAYDGHFKAGEYDKLSPVEKAVLTDIAYQSGSNVKKFTTLFDQMMTKQPPTNDSLLINWRDPKTKQLRVDKHRTNLRLNMLLGQFDLGMKHAGVLN